MNKFNKLLKKKGLDKKGFNFGVVVILVLALVVLVVIIIWMVWIAP
ncbi:MAG: hypothetical protein Q8O89_05125 [Nanoarchaeota archaeon]|nr:hypothetical protein [Nanoarchaeota archaeon]